MEVRAWFTSVFCSSIMMPKCLSRRTAISRTSTESRPRPSLPKMRVSGVMGVVTSSLAPWRDVDQPGFGGVSRGRGPFVENSFAAFAGSSFLQEQEMGCCLRYGFPCFSVGASLLDCEMECHARGEAMRVLLMRVSEAGAGERAEGFFVGGGEVEGGVGGEVGGDVEIADGDEHAGADYFDLSGGFHTGAGAGDNPP